MTTTSAFTPAPGARTARPSASIRIVAVRATRHRLHTARRALSVFGGALLSVVVLGEYADGQ